LKALELNESYHHLPQIWSDMIIFEQTHRENLIGLILRIISTFFQMGETSELSNLSQTFSEIGWKVWEIIEGQDVEREKKITWTGQMLGDLITISIKTGEPQKAYTILKKLLRSPQDVLGVPGIESLKLLLETAISQNNSVICLVTIHSV